MNDKVKLAIVLIALIILSVYVAIWVTSDSCDGMEMPTGECIWVPEGTEIDGEEVGG